jgi:hypothetical protein
MMPPFLQIGMTADGKIATLIDTLDLYQETPLPTNDTSQAPANQTYCESLAGSWLPADGFRLYCDDRYQFAFEYPLDWQIDNLGRATPDPTAHPDAYLQVLNFHSPNYNHQIYVYTGRLLKGASLKEIVENHDAYPDREYKGYYPPMRIGGKPAYGFVNRHVQDYSGVSLFFEHGDTYTLFYMKIINRSSLDLEWQIARSIQTPDGSPDGNVMPKEIIEDSYRLL